MSKVEQETIHITRYSRTFNEQEIETLLVSEIRRAAPGHWDIRSITVQAEGIVPISVTVTQDHRPLPAEEPQ